MGPKPIVGDHWIGFFPVEQNLRTDLLVMSNVCALRNIN